MASGSGAGLLDAHQTLDKGLGWKAIDLSFRANMPGVFQQMANKTEMDLNKLMVDSNDTEPVRQQMRTALVEILDAFEALKSARVLEKKGWIEELCFVADPTMQCDRFAVGDPGVSVEPADYLKYRTGRVIVNSISTAQWASGEEVGVTNQSIKAVRLGMLRMLATLQESLDAEDEIEVDGDANDEVHDRLMLDAGAALLSDSETAAVVRPCHVPNRGRDTTFTTLEGKKEVHLNAATGSEQTVAQPRAVMTRPADTSQRTATKSTAEVLGGMSSAQAKATAQAVSVASYTQQAEQLEFATRPAGTPSLAVAARMGKFQLSFPPLVRPQPSVKPPLSNSTYTPSENHGAHTLWHPDEDLALLKLEAARPGCLHPVREQVAVVAEHNARFAGSVDGGGRERGKRSYLAMRLRFKVLRRQSASIDQLERVIAGSA